MSQPPDLEPGNAGATGAVVDGLRRWAQGSLTDQAAVELLTSYDNGRPPGMGPLNRGP